MTLANVGIHVGTDVKVVRHTTPLDAANSFIAGEADGASVPPPVSYELRSRGIGHVVVDSMMDQPWSQYYCCMATFNREFTVTNPVATKRAFRALLKAADVVAKDPDRAVRALMDLGFSNPKDYDNILQDLRMIPFDVWRKHDPADTLRFYGLRLKEAGLIKGAPEQIISGGTDFRYLRELKQELKE